jgi:hypothetical protein
VTISKEGIKKRGGHTLPTIAWLVVIALIIPSSCPCPCRPCCCHAAHYVIGVVVVEMVEMVVVVVIAGSWSRLMVVVVVDQMWEQFGLVSGDAASAKPQRYLFS